MGSSGRFVHRNSPPIMPPVLSAWRPLVVPSATPHQVICLPPGLRHSVASRLARTLAIVLRCELVGTRLSVECELNDRWTSDSVPAAIRRRHVRTKPNYSSCSQVNRQTPEFEDESKPQTCMLACMIAAALACSLVAPVAAGEPSQPAHLLETVIVLGSRPSTEPVVQEVEPAREARLTTVPDLFRGTPGVIAESTFGGIDHPRLAVRGSGLQRGTQPAGRGIELRLDGLPMTYADTSYDFVEWIDPLLFDSVRLLRGGRGAREGATALGGVIDFQGVSPVTDGGLLRAETGSFGHWHGQALGEASGSSVAAIGAVTRFLMDGFRDFNEQQATRAYASANAALGDAVLRANILASRSGLELPGPQTLADIDAGRTTAQPGNIAGDWRRESDRARIAVGLDVPFAARQFTADIALMNTDTEFTRRDVQVEDNRDIAFALRWKDREDLDSANRLGLELIGQDGSRDGQLYLNGGGTMPTFTGDKGRLWADNRFDASRLSLLGNWSVRFDDQLSMDFNLGWNRHTREIRERFPTRAARPAAELDRTYDGTSALAMATWRSSDDLSFFVAASRVFEPPTFDVLYINVAGAGAGNTLVDGPNPRRPVIVDLDAQRAATLEAGVRGRLGMVDLDATIYRSWLRREIVSTSDFVNQTITSVGNADRTTRLGIEASASATLAEGLANDADRLALALSWTWTDARFDDDVEFRDNRLPIIAPHVVEARLDYAADVGWYGGPFLAWVPRGGWADYANTLRDEGYSTLGLRFGWRGERLTAFIEGRNLTDTRYASTVITAQNNLGEGDAATFAPGESRAFTIAFEWRF